MLVSSMRRLTLFGLLWRITFLQTVVVLVAGLATDATGSAVVAAVFLVTNVAAMVLLDAK